MIFVSYSRIDFVFAQSLVNHLSTEGHKVWVDYKQLDLSTPLEPQLAQAIWSSDIFILIDSANARGSKWVSLEYFLARTWKKSIRIIQPAQIVYSGCVGLRQQFAAPGAEAPAQVMEALRADEKTSRCFLENI